MRATTVRFGADLWEMLEAEAERSGESVAQYVREAALARVAFSAARRGHGNPWSTLAEEGASRDEAARERSSQLREDSAGVRAQGRQAVRRSEQLGAGVHERRTKA